MISFEVDFCSPSKFAICDFDAFLLQPQQKDIAFMLTNSICTAVTFAQTKRSVDLKGVWAFRLRATSFLFKVRSTEDEIV